MCLFKFNFGNRHYTEEGCGNTTADRAAAATAEGRPTWNLVGVNVTWERQKVPFACAAVSAVRPTVVPPRGGGGYSRLNSFDP